MHIYYIFSGGRKKRLLNNISSPKEFFYGFIELSSIKKKINYLEEEELGMKPRKSFFSIFFRKLSFFSFKVPLEMIYGFIVNKKFLKFNDKDILIATTNGIGITLAFAKKFGFIKCNLVVIAMGLIPKYSGYFKKLIYKFIFSNAKLLVISLEEKKYLKKIMPNKNIEYIPFGVDNEFWCGSKIKKEEEYILAIGNDKARDWKTLIESWDPSLPTLKIVTSKVIENIKSNVQIIKGDWKKNLLTDEQILELYRGCKFVIVPLLDTIQPSGQSVCLQAMSCKKPVIMSNISGLWDHSKLVHNDNIVLVKPKSPLLLNKAINDLLGDKTLYKKLAKNGRQLVDEIYNTENMSIYLKKIIDQLLVL